MEKRTDAAGGARDPLAELLASLPDDSLTALLRRGIEHQRRGDSPGASGANSASDDAKDGWDNFPAVLLLRAGSLLDETFSLETPDGGQHFYNVTAGRELAEARGDVLAFVPEQAGVTLDNLRAGYDGLDETYALQTLTDQDLRRPVLFILLNGKPQLTAASHGSVPRASRETENTHGIAAASAR